MSELGWRRKVWWGILVVALALVAGGCGRESAEPAGVLAQRSAVSASGVRASERLTDGVVPEVGSSWNTNRTTVFSSRHAHVDYDLGEAVELSALALMADNNDTYLVLGSLDGQKFEPLWVAPRASRPGMQWRHIDGLSKRARHLRLQPGAGDASLSVAELVAYSGKAASLPPQLTTKKSIDVALAFRSAALAAATLLTLACFLGYVGAPLGYQLLAGLLAVTGLAYGGLWFREALPVGKLEVSLVRGLCGAVGVAAVARAAFAPRRAEALNWLQTSVLGALAVLSVAAFYNMGQPQFYDSKNREPSVVHNYDMRVYFPVAKYFEELKYDGLYLASVLSFAEEHGGIGSARVQAAELRDLRDHRMRKVRDIQPQIEAVRERFSDARWAEFKKDMAYFWETMGSRGYLGSMSDHGGNATPVWMTIAYLMYGNVAASNEVLLWGGLLDPLLLLLYALVVARTFGLQTAFVSLIVFGANDFYMFGSNWAGATLRNDWMVYLGLGVCALKTERYKLGGALLALSALIRAFPAVTLLALGVPLVHQLVLTYRREGQFPHWKKIVQEQRWFVDTALGATVCVLALVLGSSLVLGFDAWPLWVKKISSFTSSPHVNHLGWLTMVAGSEGRQAEVLSQRTLLHAVGLVVFVGLAVWNAASRRPHQVALLGILLMPVFMYPANYYIHFIFLLPLLVGDLGRPLETLDERRTTGWVWSLLLGLCAAQYFTVRESDLALHFYNASALLILCLFFVLVALLPREADGRVDLSRLPFRP